MSRTFAELDAAGTVLRVIVIEPEELATGRWGDPMRWVETHADGSARVRYAGPGYQYDMVRDAFVPVGGEPPIIDAGANVRVP